uniref:Uncharacterized protein n=1 Tax=Lactuca sativa TaxID=4236 RepID=A0A9R1WSM6_LACSA|nr:hypothetical protein LSAT_V11C900457390 [Lactuca sativa]
MILIRNELDYVEFIAIAYECGVELPMCVDHFEVIDDAEQEWLDEEKEENVDNIQEEVIDDAEKVDLVETRHGDGDGIPHFFQKG